MHRAQPRLVSVRKRARETTWTDKITVVVTPRLPKPLSPELPVSLRHHQVHAVILGGRVAALVALVQRGRQGLLEPVQCQVLCPIVSEKLGLNDLRPVSEGRGNQVGIDFFLGFLHYC